MFDFLFAYDFHSIENGPFPMSEMALREAKELVEMRPRANQSYEECDIFHDPANIPPRKKYFPQPKMMEKVSQILFAFLMIFHPEKCFSRNFIVFQSTDGATSIKSEAMPYNNLMGMDYQSLQQLASLVPTSQLLNPIDRLYSMQNQYFCNESAQNVHHPHHQMCE